MTADKNTRTVQSVNSNISAACLSSLSILFWFI